MITIKEIKTEIVSVLENEGYSVIATEIKEGFQKPAVFVDVFKTGSEVQSKYMKFISVGVEMLYVPAVETHEHLIEVADAMELLLANRELEVGDRVLHIDDVACENEGNNLAISFEIEFYQETNPADADIDDGEMDIIESLEVRIDGLTTNKNRV